VLISNVANLMNRVLSFVQTRLDGVVPDVDSDEEVVDRLREGIEAYEKAIDEALLGQALRFVCDLAVFGNEYFQRKKPWQTSDVAAVAGAVHLVKGMAVLLLPYVPRFAGKILGVMGIEAPSWDDHDVALRGRKLSSERVLLERIEIDEVRDRAEGGKEADEGAKRKGTVTFSDFERLDLRVGLIQSVSEVSGAERLLRLTVDLGGETRDCVAGIKGSYGAEELVGRSIVVITNLEPRIIRGLRSECMLLAAQGDGLSLIVPDCPVEPGTSVA
jgi:methionyl-tRNA synthetase